MNRTKTGYQTYLDEFIQQDIAVVCPTCERLAVVTKTDLSLTNSIGAKAKCTCRNCGYAKVREELSSSKRKVLSQKEGTDPFFYYPLWFVTNFAGNILWAYNEAHLDFLLAHVGATHRERTIQTMINRSVASRLPRWMTSRKNRGQVLKAMLQLKEKKDA